MSYLEPNKKTTFIAITGVIVILSLLTSFGVLRRPMQFIRDLMRPGLAAVYQLGGSDEPAAQFEDVQDLAAAYNELYEEYRALQIDETTITLLKEENELLRSQLSFLSSQEYQHLGASVIAKNTDPVGNTIVLNVGSEDAVKVGDPVIIDEGYLVGKVLTVSEDTCVVRLMSDGESKIAATILGVDRTIGIVEGGYGISVRMNSIPQNEQIRIGDQVVTSGLEERVPRGLIIGEIAGIEREVYEPFQRAYITPAADLGHIRLVSVLLGKERGL
jgi:rod shape-determining protein MreC